MFQWLGFRAVTAVAPCSVPGLKTKILKLPGVAKKKKNLIFCYLNLDPRRF